MAGATGVLVAAFVIPDLFSYAMHRPEYQIEFLWRLHAVHHADPIANASIRGASASWQVVEIALAGGRCLRCSADRGIAATGTVLLGWAMVQHANLP